MRNVFGEDKKFLILQGEEFTRLKRFNKIIPEYWISRSGKVYSEKSGKFLKQSLRSKNRTKIGLLTYMRINVHISSDLFDDFEYYQGYNINKHGKKIRARNHMMTLDVHKAVMDSWKDIDNHPPEDIASVWRGLPVQVKQWVRETAVVDHINGDHLDNNIVNLRWTPPKKNCSHRKTRIEGIPTIHNDLPSTS